MSMCLVKSWSILCLSIVVLLAGCLKTFALQVVAFNFHCKNLPVLQVAWHVAECFCLKSWPWH